MASHSGIRMPQPGVGQFVSVRGRLWMIEAQPDGPFDGHRLACIDDDASGEDPARKRHRSGALVCRHRRVGTRTETGVPAGAGDPPRLCTGAGR